MRRSVDFWYFLISLRATVPGLKRWGFLTPVVTGADFLAIFWATSCFLGTFWAVDFLAVCFVLAIIRIKGAWFKFDLRVELSPRFKRRIMIGYFYIHIYMRGLTGKKGKGCKKMTLLTSFDKKSY